MQIISIFYWGNFQQKALIINIVHRLRMSAYKMLMLMPKCEPALRLSVVFAVGKFVSDANCGIESLSTLSLCMFKTDRLLRWLNTVFARALANAIQLAEKYCTKTNMASIQ